MKLMKFLNDARFFRFNLITTFLMIWTLTVYAQSSDGIFFQVTVRDYYKNLISDQQIGMRIIITTENSQVLYEEKQDLSTNNLGVVSFYIGEGYNKIGSISNVKKQIPKENLILRSYIDPKGGSDYRLVFYKTLSTVPLALHANYAIEATEHDSGFLQHLAANLDLTQITRWEKASREKHIPGDFINGGVVFYVDPSGEEGLLATPFNLSDSSIWMNVPSSTNESESLTDGESNTNHIVKQWGEQAIAAYACDTFIYMGRDDWYLPSFDEMALLFDARYLLNRALEEDDIHETIGFYDDKYWSSTEIDAEKAFLFDLGNGTGASKTTKAAIRAVRGFSGLYDANYYSWAYLGGPETELGIPVQILENEQGTIVLDVDGKRGTVFREIPMTKLPAMVKFNLNSYYGPDAGTRPQELMGTGAFRIFVGGPNIADNYIPMSESNLGTFEGIQFRIHPHVDKCPIRVKTDEGDHFESHTSTSIWMRYITKDKLVDDNGNPITGLVSDECQRRGNQCGWERVGLFEDGFGLENSEVTEVTLIISEEEISMEANGRKFSVNMEEIKNDKDIDNGLFHFDRITDFSITQTNISRGYERVEITDLRVIPIK